MVTKYQCVAKISLFSEWATNYKGIDEKKRLNI